VEEREVLAGDGAGGASCAVVTLVHMALSRSSHSNLWYAPCGHNFSLS